MEQQLTLRKGCVSYRSCSALLLSSLFSQSSQTSDGGLGGEGGCGGEGPGATSDGLLASSALPDADGGSLHGVLKKGKG